MLAAPPSNDNFANAKVIAPGSLPYSDSMDPSGATLEGSEVDGDCNPSHATVWYRFTPSKTGVYRVDTIGSNYDTLLDVFKGTALPGTFVDCNSDIDFSNPDLRVSRLAFRGVAGQRYDIRIGTTAASAGSAVVLHLRKVTPPSNDAYANATNIPSLPFDANADNVNATSQTNEPRDGDCSVARATRWYKFTPATDQLVWANTFVTTDNDTVLGVYTGSKIATASQVICNDDQWVASGKIYDSGVTFKALAGVTYHFQVGGYDAESGENGELPFHVRRVTAETNDDFASAMVVPSIPFGDTTNMRRTSRQPGEPSSCFTGMGNSAWYKYTAPATDALEANTHADTDVIAQVAVYTGTTLGGLVLVGCGSTVDFVPAMGTTYVFQVGTDNAVTAPVTFNLILDPSP